MRRRSVRGWFATVRVRTTLFATLVVTAALIVGALVLLFVQQRTLVADVEQSASSRAADVAGLAKRRALPAELTAAKEADAFTQVVDEQGRVIAASENLRELGVTHAVLPPSTHTVQTTVRLPPLDGRFRVVIRPTVTANGRVTVYAGDSLETVGDATEKMALLLGFGLPLLVGLVAVTTWWVTGHAMQPVEAIRSEVNAIGEHELHRRVPEPPTDDEVGRLARTMNAMLARLDESAERQRRFVSDASHELQSPLTSLRARLEVDLAARNEPDWRTGDREALVEVKEMQRLVDDLLTLAPRRAGRCARARSCRPRRSPPARSRTVADPRARDRRRARRLRRPSARRSGSTAPGAPQRARQRRAPCCVGRCGVSPRERRAHRGRHRRRRCRHPGGTSRADLRTLRPRR